MSWAARRELGQKKARLALLHQTLAQNVPLACKNAQDGFFTSAAEHLRQLAGICDEIARLNGEVVQLAWDLERSRERQTHLPLASGVTASAGGRAVSRMAV